MPPRRMLIAAAAPSAPPDPDEWIVPDLPLTAATRASIVRILADLQTELGPSSFSVHLGKLEDQLLSGSLHSVADVDRAVEQRYFDLFARYRPGPDADRILADAVQLRQMWRTKITELVDQLGREDALQPAFSLRACVASVNPSAAAAMPSSSSSTAAAPSPPPAASTSSTAATAMPMHAAAAATAAAASLPPRSSASAADRVERMLSGIGAAMLGGDIATVLEQARHHSSLLHRIAELEAAHAALLSTLEAQDHSMQRQIVGVKREKIDTEEALIKTTQLKRKGERELDSERKKLRATADELEQKTEQLEEFNCISCEDARATVAYLPCIHILHCEPCDRKWQGGPDRPAAAGLRTCPKCRCEIASTRKAHVGH